MRDPEARPPDATRCNHDARQIYQGVMDRFAEVFFHSDLDLLCDLMILPSQMITFETRMVYRTRDDLRTYMDVVRRMIDRENVTTYLRVCLAARFVDADTIDGTHESHVLNGMRYIVPRFPVRCRLRRAGPLWKVNLAEHAVEDHAFIVPRLHNILRHTIDTGPACADGGAADPAHARTDPDTSPKP